VPTHENGNCLFWEFATDHYDIAFGVYFEWTIPPDDNVQVHISDSSDEDEEDGTGRPRTLIYSLSAVIFLLSLNCR